jgi:hypothetical protein
MGRAANAGLYLVGAFTLAVVARIGWEVGEVLWRSF